MEDNLQLFAFEGNQVRTLEIKNEPWFIGKDVVEILGYKNGSRDINRHVDEEDRQNYQNGTFESPRGFAIINESGLYSLILSSKMPNAKKFKHWVTSEVLPAIRKHGAYMTDEKAFDVVHNKDGLADLLQQAADQLKQKDIQIEQMKPKALFADSVATSKTTVLVGELAKILRGNGIDIGPNRLLGLFKIKETVINHSNGTTSISKTTKVTGKGQQYFINKLLVKTEN